MCIIALAGDSGDSGDAGDSGTTMRSAAVYHPNPSIAERVRRAVSAEYADGAEPMATIMRTGQPLIDLTVDKAEFRSTLKSRSRQLWDEFGGIESLLGVPVGFHDATLGIAVAVRFNSDGPFAEDDVDFLQEVADRVGRAVGNARLFARTESELYDRREAESGLQRGNRELARRVESRSDELQRSHREIRTLFEDAPVGMTVVDVSGLFEYLRALGERDVGDVRSYFADNPESVLVALAQIELVDANPAFLELFEFEDKSAALGSLSRFYASGAQDFFVEQFVDVGDGHSKSSGRCEIRMPSGRVIDFELAWTVVPGFEDDFRRVVGWHIDRSEVSRAEQDGSESYDALEQIVQERTAALEHQNLELDIMAGIVEASGAAIFAASRSGRVVVWSPGSERLLGYTAAEIVGEPASLLIPEADRATQSERVAAVLSGATVDFDAERICKDGTLVSVSATLSPVADDRGEVVAIGGVYKAQAQTRGGTRSSALDPLVDSPPDRPKESPATRVGDIGDFDGDLDAAAERRAGEYAQRCAEEAERAATEHAREVAEAESDEVLHAAAAACLDTASGIESVGPPPELESVLRNTARSVAESLGDACVMRLLSDNANWMLPVAYFHVNRDAMAILEGVLSQPERPDETLLGAPLLKGAGILIERFDQQSQWHELPPGQLVYLEQVGISSIVSVPLRDGGEVIGSVTATRDAGGAAYTADDFDLLGLLARRAGQEIAASGGLG